MYYYEVTYYELIDKERVTCSNVFKANSLEAIKKYLVDDKTVIEIGKCEERNIISYNEHVIDIEFENYKKRYNELESEFCNVLDVQRYHEQIISYNQELNDKLRLEKYRVHWFELVSGVAIGVLLVILLFLL